MYSVKVRLLTTLLTLIISSPSWSESECSDYDAKNAANKVTEKFMAGKVFHQAEVLKVHRPSKQKEIASYIKVGDLYYTVFSLVNGKCTVKIMKRTNGKY